MKKNKKNIIIISSVVAAILIILTVYIAFIREDSDTSLTLVERQWIESNRNRVFDFGILNNIPVFSRDGHGIVFDFIEDFEDEVNLNFNKSSHRTTANIQSDYSFRVVNSKGDDDILVYQDHFVLLSNLGRFNSLSEIEDLEIGVLDDYLSSANASLKGATNVSFKAYGDLDELFDAYGVSEDGEESDESSIDAIILPYLQSLEIIVSNDNIGVSYPIYDMTNDYVITLGDEDRLNNIIEKYFDNWKTKNFESSFNANLASDYFVFSDTDSQDRAAFRSKRYIMGMVEDPFYASSLPFDDSKGFHSNILNTFKSVAEVEVSIEFFTNNDDLLDAFNANEIDFYYNNLAPINYNMDVLTSSSIFEDNYVVVSKVGNHENVSNALSLASFDVHAISGTAISEHLDSQGVDLILSNNLNTLLNRVNEEDLIVLDQKSFEYLSFNDLSDYYVLYTGSSSSDNNYVFRDISDNEVFNEFLSFYIDSANIDAYRAASLENALDSDSTNYFLLVINYLGYVLFFGIVGYAINVKSKEMTKGKKKTINKADKLKYIDMLTSLKNRNYLSENIESWDESDIYPQAIVIIDLNNLAYVNDNYGHQEGDKIIKEAANVLITSQIENSEIIRTDGNEFLIYLVGHDEKQVAAYVRRLNKELKNISHGFGAAIGHSVIENAIKTVDDAINEATLEMKKQKEELNN